MFRMSIVNVQLYVYYTKIFISIPHPGRVGNNDDNGGNKNEFKKVKKNGFCIRVYGFLG